MKLRTCIATACAVMLAFACLGGLAACGSQQGRFEGYAARDLSEMDEIGKQALELVKKKKEADSGKEEGELSKTVAEAFSKANASYRAGDYATAQEQYEGVIVAYPSHYGANTNLALALLQQDKTEEALAQAIVALCLFEDAGCLLNTQVAAAACKFDVGSDAFLGKLEELMGDAGSSRNVYSMASSGDYEPFIRYNNLWSDVEVRMHDATSSNDSGAMDGEEAYRMLRDRAESVVSSLPDDKDAGNLLTYIEAVGKQLGYENAAG